MAEVGVYFPEVSNILDFINDGIKTTLVEPDPGSIKKINDFFEGKENITLYPIALYDQNTTLTLMKRGPSTFLKALDQSPAIVNDQYTPELEDEFEVEAKKFSEIDDGSIDLLSVDVEGAEWFVIKHMVSRPKVISLETHGKYYINPNLDKIDSWMENNNYLMWYKTNSDSIYIRSDVFKPSQVEKFAIWRKDLYLKGRRLKKIFRKKK